ncbi:uncharacterized protein At2g34160-like [Bidens hawaiensis]|uniref:uncharacterized protein At2g34160-like n=1 Tax=Bidens hawaiensis TaxID=980011 RepID=UPI00404A925D
MNLHQLTTETSETDNPNQPIYKQSSSIFVPFSVPVSLYINKRATNRTKTAMDEQKIAEVAPKTTKMPRIRVSNTKKPFIFYLNLAKKYVNRYNNVELTALGKAIPTVVVISEILKSDGMATQNLISISTIKNKDESTGKSLQKAKIEIVMTLNEHYDNSKAKENILKKKNAQHKVSLSLLFSMISLS